MEQITLQASNSRLLETLRAERNGVILSAEATSSGGALERLEGSCSSGDGRNVSITVYRDGSGNDYGRNMNGSESLIVEAGELIEAFITAAKARYTESSSNQKEE